MKAVSRPAARVHLSRAQPWRASLLGAASLLSACAPPFRDDASRSRSSLRVCSGLSTAQGVDVSRYQGAVDWASLHASGYHFAIARVSDGISHPDDRFAENWGGMKSAGLVRGAYQYFEPSEDALQQAALVVQQVGRLGSRDLPVALDAETTGGLPTSALASRFRAWLSAVESGTGKRPIIYTAAYFWDALSGEGFDDHDLWVASYTTPCPELPASWTRWAFWQKGTGNVPGISPVVDLDEFDGTPQDLAEFAEASASTANAPRADGGQVAHAAPHRSPSVDHQLPTATSPPVAREAGGPDAGGGPSLDGAAPLLDGAAPLLDGAAPLLDGAAPLLDATVAANWGADGSSNDAPRANDHGANPRRSPGCSIASRRPSAEPHLGVLILLAAFSRVLKNT